MNPMNMNVMNPAAGGPVGGAMAMMNNAATPNHTDPNESLKTQLNTYIYDYFLKHGFHDCARALLKEDRVTLQATPNTKQSPRQVNGIDDSMDTDSKDDTIPHDLPRPKVPDSPPGSSFLFDWFCIFSEMFVAQRQKGKPGQMNVTRQYLQQTENLQRMRDNQQNGMMRNPQMIASQMQFNNMRRNGAIPTEMQKTMMRNNMSQQQMQQFAQQKQMMQNMQRGDQGDIDMNGNRPQSPSSADNTGSPSKRPRLEGGQFNGQQMGPNGRGQGMPNQAANPSIQMMMKNGINPQGLTPAQFQSFQNQNPAVQQKSIQVYAQNLAQHHNRSAMNQGAMQNGMMNPGAMPNQGSPMMQPMNDPNFMMDPNFNPGVNAQIRQGIPQGAGGQGGNHALQDYQMQLMLLEQQNKKRLMMARQEQDSMTRADGQPGIPAQQGMQPPGMSPSGSRNGPSPNPSDQLKRTPQLGQTGLPGSPTPGGPGGSPAPMNFNGQMPPDFNAQMFAMGKIGDGMMPGQGIRPPGQMNPNMPGGRMPSGNWQGGPQGQPVMQQPGQGPQNVGTPQQRTEMPPPQAPAGGANAGRGTQPSSPSTSNQAPPTPQQSNKANPKGKKGKADNNKRPAKKASTAAASGGAGANAADSGEPPATPTPSTPITPVHPNSFNKNQAAANAAANNTGPTSAPQQNAAANNAAGQQANAAGGQPQPSAAAANAADANAMAMSNAPFGDFNGVDPSFNLDFGPLDAPDVLENFDFDSFLNNPDDGVGAVGGGFNFDASGLGLENYGVEGGAEV